MKIAKDMVVSVRYEIFDANGSLLEETGEPISYLHGGYDGIFPTVEEALQDKEVGAKLNLRITPENAFGEYDHDLVRVEPRNLFPEEIAIGMQFEGGVEDGDEDDYALFTIVDITDTEVTVDGNHPLAGKTLDFVGEVMDVRTATSDELEHGHSHDANGHHH